MSGLNLANQALRDKRALCQFASGERRLVRQAGQLQRVEGIPVR
jgi:hypothetical protein